MLARMKQSILDMPLRNKLITLYLLIAIIPLGILGAFSYDKSSKMILEKVCQTLLESLSQVNYSLNYFVQDIEQLTMYIYGNDQVQETLSKDGERSLEEKNRDYKKMYSILESFLGFKNWDIQIYLLANNGERYFTGELLPNEYHEINPNWGLFRQARIAQGNVVWETHYAMKKIEDFGIVLSAGRMIKNIVTNEPIGYVVIDILEEELADKYSKAQHNSASQMYVLDANGYVISSSPSKQQVGTKFTETFASRIFEGSKGFFQTKNSEGEAEMVIYDTSQVTGFKLVSVVPVDVLTKDGQIIRNLTLLIMIAGIVVSFWLAFILSVNITRPLRKLSSLMRQAEVGNLNVSFRSQYNDEVGQLGRSFNMMLARIDTLIKEDYQKQIKVQEAEIKAIQAQFNPHFLYNVLDSINWMARLHKIDEISKAAVSLGELLRFSIRKDRQYITIEEDMQQIDNYLLLQKMRYREKFQVIVDVDEQIKPYYTLKLLIQPLVENAISHGLEMKLGMGKLEIIGRQLDDERIQFIVRDNGIGISESKLKEILVFSDYESTKTGHTGIGIRNLRKRLQLYFDDKAAFAIESHVQQGTTVELVIPLMKNAGEEHDQTVDC